MLRIALLPAQTVVNSRNVMCNTPLKIVIKLSGEFNQKEMFFHYCYFKLFGLLLDLFDNTLFAPRIFKIDNAADKRHP